jgi:hypothetical protein
MISMSQDQYGQARGSGSVVHGDVVPEEETEKGGSEEPRTMTRFQKVASALRGGSDRDEQDTVEAERAEADRAETAQTSTGQAAADRSAADQAAADQATSDRVAMDRAAADRTGTAPDAPTSGAPAMDPDAPAASTPWVTRQDEAAMADSPISRETETKRDYWDEANPAAAGHEDPVEMTRPDVPGSATGAERADTADMADHPATEPDMFETTSRRGDETAPLPEATRDVRDSREQAGAATIADVPAGGTATVPAGGTAADDVAAADAAASDTGATGRHAAGTPAAAGAPAAGSAAAGDLRPGEAAGSLGDFSDLTYGNLIPNGETYTAQWQEIQFKFVDDPHGSVTEAAEIVSQVTAKLEAAIQERVQAIEARQHAIAEQQRSLRGRWGEGSNADTESMRETLRMYKTFLDQLIGPRAG